MTFDPSRRRFFRNAAATISLPFLPSLMPRSAWAACPPTPRRFLAFSYGVGTYIPDFTPPTTGPNWPSTMILDPIAKSPQRSKVLILTGIDDRKLGTVPSPAGGHAHGAAPFLTQVPVTYAINDTRRSSVDQIIARSIATCGPPVLSLSLSVERIRTSGSCDGADCALSDSMSWWQGAAQPTYTTAQAAWDQLYKGFEPGASKVDAERRLKLRTSVLDHVAGELGTLKPKMSKSDRDKVDSALTSVREYEQKLQNLSKAKLSCTIPARPASVTDQRMSTELMMELIKVAFQCDATRVMTFRLTRTGSNLDYRWLLPGAQYTLSHDVSHHSFRARSPDPVAAAKLDSFKKISQWKMSQLAAMIGKLDSVTDSDGKTILDNTVVYSSSEIACGSRHSHWDLPVVMAGSLGGKLVTGQHISFVNPVPVASHMDGNPTGATRRTIGDLFLSVLRGFGVTQPTFGDTGTRPINEIMT